MLTISLLLLDCYLQKRLLCWGGERERERTWLEGGEEGKRGGKRKKREKRGRERREEKEEGKEKKARES